MRKVTFAIQMRASRPLAALVLAAGLVVTAVCGGPSTPATQARASGAGSPTASAPAPASPHASPPAQPQPVTGAYGVLVTNPGAGSSYTLSIVGVDGKVAASAQASSPAAVSCANAAAALVPYPVSTSNSRVYFMDGAGAIHYLAPNGDAGQATAVPAGTGARRSMFAVSPDDQRIAVVVDDFTSSGATTRLYVEDLNGGGNHLDLFTENGAYTLWPVGWHGTNNLVLGKIAACTQGGGPFVGSPTELHVVDPATANRRFTIGSSTCPPVNRPSPAGVVCENPPNATVLNWTAGTVHTYPIQGPVGAYLSPGGGNVAFVDNVGTIFTGGGSAMAGVFTCTWIDDTHVLAGGDAQQQPRVGNLANGSVVPVAAQGDCGGRLPGGL